MSGFKPLVGRALGLPPEAGKGFEAEEAALAHVDDGLKHQLWLTAVSYQPSDVEVEQGRARIVTALGPTERSKLEDLLGQAVSRHSHYQRIRIEVAGDMDPLTPPSVRSLVATTTTSGRDGEEDRAGYRRRMPRGVGVGSLEWRRRSTRRSSLSATVTTTWSTWGAVTVKSVLDVVRVISTHRPVCRHGRFVTVARETSYREVSRSA